MAHWLADDRIDAWVPGSVGAALECQTAVRLAIRDGDRREFDPWLHAFGSGTSTPILSQAPNQVGLSGGCAALQDPTMAYTWTTQLAPLLRRQMKHYREGHQPVPLGRFGDHPVVGVCALQDNGLNHCRALDLPLYDHLYTGHQGRYSFPTDLPVVGADGPSGTGCPSYNLPGIGNFPA
jgi:hypothetical protein